MDQDLILINGTQGGGQVLRTALSLSMITGRAFRMMSRCALLNPAIKGALFYCEANKRHSPSPSATFKLNRSEPSKDRLL